MSFSNAGNVWVWDCMGLYGRDGGHVRENRPAIKAADEWIARYGTRQPVPVASAAKPAAPKPVAPAPVAKPAAPKPTADPVAVARAKYGRAMPDAFNAKTGALRKGWALVNGVPSWADAVNASATAIEAHVHRPRPQAKPAVAAE